MDPTKIDEFVNISKSTRDFAKYYLTLSDGVVSKAVSMLYEDIESDEDDATVSAATTCTKELTILEWNIQGLLDDFLKMRTVAIVDIIKSISPDVIMLQEVVPGTYNYLYMKLMGTYEMYTSPELLHHEIGGYFVMLLVKKSTIKPTSVSCSMFFSTEQGRDMITFKGKVGMKNITLMVSHLESTKECASTRKWQLQEVFDKMLSVDSDHTVIFGADTNLRDYEVADVMKQNSAYSSQIKDIWEEIGRPQDARFSWDLQKNDNQITGGKARLRFERLYTRSLTSSSDGIFKPVEMKFVGTNRLSCGLFPSDHWGILTKFKC